ncbi:LysR family transcriptional regulator [Aliiruegeria lutimaris]|uniref:DNA-binding transcriptional regulator, LysR family n=1 Tax=Aliiruegeria lutimaris TaxID=571298 RepID=A0A1G8YJ14_9RHOB|nr:LysR family transcriptional regulator [Aliiruegeria lutimaris]SDK02778.1 DNA-binding transcriptional regulator, LysR family [Aliiruegeria lutimaris]
MNKSLWDDIRYVLAVAETGSLNAAATQLGVTHATVLRRVSIFEQKHGQAVFQKRPTGYRVLPEAEPILAEARNVRDAVLALDRAFLGTDPSLSGPVRIASTDSICTCILPPIVEEISRIHPDLEIVLQSANFRHDFLRLSADIAVRPAIGLEEGMFGEKAGCFEFAAYATDNCRDVWLRLEGPLQHIPVAKWMQESIAPDRSSIGSDSFLVLREFIAAGAGYGILPEYVGDADQRLTRLAAAIPAFRTPIWVATLKELSNNVRFRTVREILRAEIAKTLRPISATV